MTKTLKLTDRDRRLVCLYLAGVTLDAIRAEFGLRSRGHIIRKVQELGLPPRGFGKSGVNATVNLFPCIVAWAKRGFTPLEIAVGIGCTDPDLVASIGARQMVVSREATPEDERFRGLLVERIKIMRLNEKCRVRRRRKAVRAAVEARA